MARSLTVQPEEKASTSPLLTFFLLAAVAFLLIGTLAGAGDETASASTAEVVE